MKSISGSISSNSNEKSSASSFLPIDESIRKASLYFLVSSLVWLIFASACALISSIKAISPMFLSSYEILTYGRVEGMFRVSLLMGWCCNSIYALAFWLMARLSNVNLGNGKLLLISGFIWNISVTISIIGVMFGDSTGFNWFDYPEYTG